MARRNRLSRLHSYVPLSSRRCISPRYPTSPHMTTHSPPHPRGFPPPGPPAGHPSRTFPCNGRCGAGVAACIAEHLFASEGRTSVPPMHATALRHLDRPPPPRPGPAPAPGPGATAPAAAERAAPSRSTRSGWWPASCSRPSPPRRPAPAWSPSSSSWPASPPSWASSRAARPRRGAPRGAPPAPPVTHASAPLSHERGSGLDSAEAVAPDRDRWGSPEISTLSPAGRPALPRPTGASPRRPFRLEPDPRFAYERADHREGLARILFGITQLGGLVVITGEIGAGKTLLAQTLRRTLDGEGFHVAEVANPPRTARGPAGGGAGGDGRRAGRRLDRAPRRAPARAAGGRRGRRAAHRAGHRRGPAPRPAAPSTRCACSPTRGAEGPGAPVVLLGQPELTGRVERQPQVAQRVVVRYHLGADDRRGGGRLRAAPHPRGRRASGASSPSGRRGPCTTRPAACPGWSTCCWRTPSSSRPSAARTRSARTPSATWPRTSA